MSESLRIVLCSAFVGGYRLVADWATRHGHELAMVVTLPGTRELYGGGQQDLLDALPEQQDVLAVRDLAGHAGRGPGGGAGAGDRR